MTTRRRIAKALALVLCAVLLTASAAAYGRVDVETPVSLTLTYQHTSENRAVPGMTLRLYKVYDMTDAVRFTPTESFSAAYEKEFQFDLEKWTTQGSVDWPRMASTLESLLVRDRAAAAPALPLPVRTGKTDATGTVAFKSTDEDALMPGLYLVLGDSLALGGYTYTPQTFLVSLPMLQAQDIWRYELQASGKMGITQDSSGGDTVTTSVSVVKEWVGDDSASRPDAVTVQLLRDGAPYQTAQLDASNHWQYSWKNLNADSRWQLAEIAVPGDYTVSITQVGTSFVVTNTKALEIPNPDVPGGNQPEEVPGGNQPGEVPGGDIPGDTGGGDQLPELPGLSIPEDDVPLGNKLPQTGMAWWPVQLLTVVGLLLLIAGFALTTRGKRRNHGR